MLPDILGYKVEDAVKILSGCGIHDNDIIVNEYSSPKSDKMGNDRRVLKIVEGCEKVILTVSYF